MDGVRRYLHQLILLQFNAGHFVALLAAPSIKSTQRRVFAKCLRNAGIHVRQLGAHYLVKVLLRVGVQAVEVLVQLFNQSALSCLVMRKLKNQMLFRMKEDLSLVYVIWNSVIIPSARPKWCQNRRQRRAYTEIRSLCRKACFCNPLICCLPRRPM